MSKSRNEEVKTVIILGASFATGNLGVSALAWSSIRIVRERWPDARIVLVGAGKKPAMVSVWINDSIEELQTWPVRYCKNLIVSNHILLIYLFVAFNRIYPFSMKANIKSSTLEKVLSCSIICDITGGDSFSDIYGLTRFLRGFLLKYLCQMTGKPFILLPQTYGPYKSWMAKHLAKIVLMRSAMVFSRDKEGVQVVKDIIGSTEKVRLCPDLAFVMEPRKTSNSLTSQLKQVKREGLQVVGLNISGLLYNGGYNRDNMFELVCDYPNLVKEIVIYFARKMKTCVILVPHVMPFSDFSLEDDYVAAGKIYNDLPSEIQQNIILMESGYDQNETKYIIGLCDFFLGARMHATIAAISQGIPAIAMAYSKKFQGVFGMAGVGECVVDLRMLSNNEVLERIVGIYQRRDKYQKTLKNSVPKLKKQISSIMAIIDN